MTRVTYKRKSNGRIRSFLVGAAVVGCVFTYYNAWYGDRQQCNAEEIILAHYQEVFNDLSTALEVTRVTTGAPIPQRKPII